MLNELVKSNANIKAVMNPEKLRVLTRSQRRKASKMDRSLTSSFTDLAALMSKIPIVRRNNSLQELSHSEDEIVDGQCVELSSFMRGELLLQVITARISTVNRRTTTRNPVCRAVRCRHRLPSLVSDCSLSFKTFVHVCHVCSVPS